MAGKNGLRGQVRVGDAVGRRMVERPGLGGGLSRLVWMAILVGSTVHADQITVDPTGNGDRIRIQQAINAASDGDEILVRPGTYSEKIVIDKEVRIVGTDPRECKIVYSGTSDAVTFTDSSDNAQILKLSITSLGGRGVVCERGSAPIIKNCVIVGNSSSGLFIDVEAYPIVINNTIVSNTGDGVLYKDAIGRSAVRGTIANNIIAWNDVGMSWSCRIAVNGSCRTFPSQFRFNNVWANRVEEYDNKASSRSYTASEGSISEDPEFVDATGGDYRLKASSLSLDAGWDASVYTDLDGTRNDMGAYGGPDAPLVSVVQDDQTQSGHDVSSEAIGGDLDGDGSVNAGDAILVLRISAGLLQPSVEQQASGDVNNDGVVDAGDAILILRRSAGLVATFGS